MLSNTSEKPDSRLDAAVFKLGSALAAIGDSRRRLFAVSIAAGVAMAAIEFAIHKIFQSEGLPPGSARTADALFIGATSFLFSLAWLSALRARRRKVREEMEKVAELNHRIRNALQVILHSEFTSSAERARLVLESVDKIEATVRDLFPTAVTPRGSFKRRQ